MKDDMKEYYAQKEKEDKQKKKIKTPVAFIVFRVLSLVCLIIGIVGVIKAVNTDPYNNFGFVAMAMLGFFFAFGFACWGFYPQIQKFTLKMGRHVAESSSEELKGLSKTMIGIQKDVQEENKDSLTSIASTSADINSEAITKKAKAVKKGLKDTKFCKNCGKEIDADSSFCSKCGCEQ